MSGWVSLYPAVDFRHDGNKTVALSIPGSFFVLLHLNVVRISIVIILFN